MPIIPISAWPGDLDGDVFRRMEENGFDFTTETDIEFNVDVAAWPPAPALVEALRERYGAVELVEPDDEGDGYLMIEMHALCTYELVMTTQKALSELAAPYGGECDSWGVFV